MEELMNELTGSSTLHYFRVLFLPGLKTSIRTYSAYDTAVRVPR